MPLNLINESYIFIALFLGLPLLGVLMGYYQKGKNAIVSKFFYRFAIFMVVLYVVGFGLCLGL
ncbi:hypothetical protein [uncultured Tenacibaculum sp.]|uniref:hypothetical protein n=1 Tax=uncultured Tenacibaculum sp. TaxID=174713 RepID=UPI00260F3B43|nr:hypothetical protein [uncultured Tenacibaculum sp.]